MSDNCISSVHPTRLLGHGIQPCGLWFHSILRYITMMIIVNLIDAIEEHQNRSYGGGLDYEDTLTQADPFN